MPQQRKGKKSRDVPPELVLFEGPDELVVRGRLTLETIWINEGGSGMGLHVSAWGPALDDGFLELTHAVVGADESAKRVALSAGRSEEGVLVDFDVADWVLGAAFGPRGGKVSAEELRTIAASMVHVQLHGIVARAGRTELHLAVCPVGDVDSDAISVALDLASPST